MPLYMHTALLIIRNMGVDTFSYLEPFLDGLTAAVLFDIVLGVFTQWQTVCGKIVGAFGASRLCLYSDLLCLRSHNVIRLQRHLATRVIIATQEPTVILPTILDLASIIICHRFSSPAWCTHLARHASAGNESVSWYQQVILLATGDALVFSPAAVITADERGGVVLLGRGHLKLRFTTSLLSLPTPPTSESNLPAQQETRLEGTSPAPSAAAPNPTMADAMPLVPLSAPATSATGGPVPAPSAPSVVASQSTASAPRAVPARLKHLVDWLLRSGAARESSLGAAGYLNGQKQTVVGKFHIYPTANAPRLLRPAFQLKRHGAVR
ncbi:hypothetical protein B0H14DRAFT_3664386 [Mycena olivaceomarginata]|nr:hypothetical protein B0H14DRAFT_3664386 [Mycena olivaceomarginata]